MRSESLTGAGEAQVELESLMCAIAAGAMPHRVEATAYSRCRADLLAGAGDMPLPGFVHQCVTVFKFRDFITLYDPDPAMREAFVRRAFERCRAAAGEPRMAVGGARSQRWRF